MINDFDPAPNSPSSIVDEMIDFDKSENSPSSIDEGLNPFSSQEISNSTSPTLPKRGRGRPRKSESQQLSDLKEVSESVKKKAEEAKAAKEIYDSTAKKLKESKQRGALAPLIEDTFVHPIKMWANFDPYCATVTMQQLPKVADAFDRLAQQDPRVARILDKALSSSAWADLALAFAPIIQAIILTHTPIGKKIQSEMMSNLQPLFEDQEQVE